MECVLLALGQAVPEKTSALWAKHLCPKFAGRRREKIDPRTGSLQLYSVATFHGDGGNGAIYGYDGTDGLGPYNDAGGMLKAPIEVEEWEMPYRWLKYEFITDSGGHGKWRGGLGPHIEMLNTSDPKLWQPHDCVAMTGNSDGELFPPSGLMGGTGGKTHRMAIRRKGKSIKLRTLSSAYLRPGDVIWTKSGGGGGLGDPLERDIEKVRWDVLNGYISNKVARNVYGVVISPKTFVVNDKATTALREKLKKEKSNREGGDNQ
jgi:N-methylhydantoinase B